MKSSADVEAFLGTFPDRLVDETPEGRSERARQWNRVDANGNGLASAAEVDRWVKSALVSKHGKDDGGRLWRAHRPATLRAFEKVKDLAPPRSEAKGGVGIGGGGPPSASGDDYITKREFRLLVALLRAYARMVDAFSVLDGGGAGIGPDDDRRIDRDEWMGGYEKLGGRGFAALGDDLTDDPEGTFRAMNAERGGERVLLAEWCDHLERAEVRSGTEMGRLFALVAERRESRRAAESAAAAGEGPSTPAGGPPPPAAAAAAAAGPSDALTDFAACFAPLAEETEAARAARARAWSIVDANGNGVASLAELDRWIKSALVSRRGGSEERGEALWRRYRPSYLRAFRRARDVAPDGAAEPTLDGDDYISRREFRLLVGFLCAYARMQDAFAVIDGSGAAEFRDDRRIERREWLRHHRKVAGHGLVALAAAANPEAAFDAMDADKGGMVLFGEWCRFLEEAEVKARTEMGKLFAIAVGGKRRKTAAAARSLTEEAGAEAEGDAAGPSVDFEKFSACFVELVDRTGEGREARAAEWAIIDINSNGLASLAEIDRWVAQRLAARCGKDRGGDLWRLFRPSFIRAFHRAKALAPALDVGSANTNTTTDDYISKREFRPLVAYLCVYARMLDAFSVIDGGSAGVDANDDRRIELREWLEGYRKVKAHGLVGLADVNDPHAAFEEMDADSRGMVLLKEWCQYLEGKEAKAGMEMGKEFTNETEEEDTLASEGVGN